MAFRRQGRAPAWCLSGSVLLLAVASLFAFAPAGPRVTGPPPGPARLLVLVVFDQMRGDYLSRWHELFVEGGFRRLTRDGAWFQNCHYPYGITLTGPGHASLATGGVPAEHGIIANNWYDRGRAAEVYCVESDRYARVPPAPPKKPAAATTGKRKKAAEGCVAPDRLLAPTFADLLKDATGGRGKVIALSFKDRSAALMGGRHPDGCYWLDTTTGDAVTSTYYRDRLPGWVADFNRSRTIDRWKGGAWTPLRPNLDYSRWTAAPAGSGTFNYPLAENKERKWKSYYDALYYSALGNELVLDLAQRAIAAEQLGQHDTTDLLVVSFSSNDTIGHAWGPDSPEVLDVTLRADLVMQRLLATLDAKVGPGRYLLGMSADHGVCPLPEVSRARGQEATRIPLKLLSTQAEEFLRQTFGRADEKSQWVEATAEPWVYLNRPLLANRGLDPAKVETALARWLEQQPGILKAYTRTELTQGPPSDDALGASLWRSFRPERSGDVAAVLKPYHLFDEFPKGTTHGTPHPYDTHVPLLFYGPGMPAQVFQERVAPQSLAAVFARHAGTALPRGSQAVYPESLNEPRLTQGRSPYAPARND